MAVARASFWLAIIALVALSTLGLRRQIRGRTRPRMVSEGALSMILDDVGAFVYIKDLDLRYRYVNQKVVEWLGRPADAILGLRDQDLFDAATAEHLRQTDERVLQQGQRITIEEQNRQRAGQPLRTFMSVKQPLRDQYGRIHALCGISTDITDVKHSEQKIRRLAVYDPLTGLPNRALLLDRIHHAFLRFARSRCDGALLFIDLDNFKLLNDTLGHAKGDLLLKQVAERLGRCLRLDDTLARLGGDEFVLLAENLGRDFVDVAVGVKVVAERLLHELCTQPIELDNELYTVSASIGVALMSYVSRGAGGAPADDLLRRADMAMYEAKAAGRNQVKCFDPSMQQALNRRAELESLIKDGLRLSQFQLAYQPIVDEDGCVVGAEALARWPHPQKGPIAPGEFIAAAENSGQILALGEWVLRTACAELAAWGQSDGFRELTLSVNVSARQIRHPEFVAQVAAALQQTGADPHRLELELTESVFAHDFEGVSEKMRSLQRIGLRFSLDDFGTGYSSLTYLKRLPFQRLKIDQSFVRDLLLDENDAAIVRAVLTLGESLGLEVVAEGVETAEHFEALRRLGGRRFQGYFFGRPGRVEDMLNAAVLVS